MDARFKTVDKRFDAVDRRFDAVDKRFDWLTVRMDAGFSSMHDKMNAILRVLDDKYEHNRTVLNTHEDRIQDLRRLASNHSTYSRLTGATRSLNAVGNGGSLTAARSCRRPSPPARSAGGSTR